MSAATEVTNANGNQAELTSTTDTPSADLEKPTDSNETKKEEQAPMKQLYEQSTQYNHWRYTQNALNELRTKVNQEVIANIKQNIEDEREQRIAQGLPTDDLPVDLNYLNVQEELALLGFYERRMVQIFRYWKLPSHVTATAIMYMKRFFLENTVMDFHPKDVMLTCMFLARKTENFLMTIDEFSTALKSPPESILNLEFLALTENMERLQAVYESALKLIDTSLYTDLCFLYQPSQIALAAMRIACKKESYDFERYANYKFKANESSAQKYNETLLPILLNIEKVLNEDPRCIEVEKSVATEIDRRLKMCKDPAKNTESLIYNKRKRLEANDDDDDDDDKDDDRPDKRAKLGDDSSPE
ncbi:hypothetical protein BGZ46_000750 [Entomortierella lignicola]|nr:hypothetical protein BGZ46_000750 [Entomortierella lignicola]